MAGKPIGRQAGDPVLYGDAGLVEKPPVRETPVKSRPKARAQERLKAAEEAAGAAAGRS